jgi:predicted small secreted protein
MKNIVVLLLALSALAGCNTVRGVGQDIQAGGEAIQRSTK